MNQERFEGDLSSAADRVVFERLPLELDTICTGHGYTMAGWDFNREAVSAAIKAGKMLNPSMELGTNICPWNCSFCFTESPDGPNLKSRLKHEISIERRLNLIREAADLGAKSINVIGAGEPTLDPNFWQLINKMRECDIRPIVYTEGSIKLGELDFCKRLYDSGATVVLKMNSLWNADYQNTVVRGSGEKFNQRSSNYFEDRQIVLNNLFECGFNRHDPTRLAFDTIICQENKDEVVALHRYARQNNIFVLFVNYLPSGRSSDGVSTAITKQEQMEIFAQMAEIDQREFGLAPHRSDFPYAGGTPCTIRGLGLYVKIGGQVFDCPGESEVLGNIQDEGGLKTAWEKARHIQKSFDGGCRPRDDFWNSHPEFLSKKQLPVLNL